MAKTRIWRGFFLLLALALALAFEFVNGFHDTANAVATVIYTNTLKPVFAVVWSGIWNLLGAVGIVGGVLRLLRRGGDFERGGLWHRGAVAAWNWCSTPVPARASR